MQNRQQIGGCQEQIEVDEEWRVTANGYEVSLWGDENILELDRGDGWL